MHLFKTRSLARCIFSSAFLTQKADPLLLLLLLCIVMNEVTKLKKKLKFVLLLSVTKALKWTLECI